MRYLRKFQHKKSLPFFSREESCFIHGYWEQLNEGFLGVPHLSASAFLPLCLQFSLLTHLPHLLPRCCPAPCSMVPALALSSRKAANVFSLLSHDLLQVKGWREVNLVPSAPMIILLSTSFYNSGVCSMPDRVRIPWDNHGACWHFCQDTGYRPEESQASYHAVIVQSDKQRWLRLLISKYS